MLGCTDGACSLLGLGGETGWQERTGNTLADNMKVDGKWGWINLAQGEN